MCNKKIKFRARRRRKNNEFELRQCAAKEQQPSSSSSSPSPSPQLITEDSLEVDTKEEVAEVGCTPVKHRRDLQSPDYHIRAVKEVKQEEQTKKKAKKTRRHHGSHHQLLLPRKELEHIIWKIPSQCGTILISRMK
jgi:hypothetical protein